MLQKTRDYYKRYATPYLKNGEPNPYFDDIPYTEELELLLDIHEDTIHEWKKVHHEFSEAYKKIKKLQRLRLHRRLNYKESFTPGIIFQLKANHGMIETERLQHVTKDDEPLEGLVIIKHNGDTTK